MPSPVIGARHDAERSPSAGARTTQHNRNASPMPPTIDFDDIVHTVVRTPGVLHAAYLHPDGKLDMLRELIATAGHLRRLLGQLAICNGPCRDVQRRPRNLQPEFVRAKAVGSASRDESALDLSRTFKSD